MDQKDEKISKLRSLLGQANTKIRNLKQLLVQKEKQVEQIKMDYQKKLKSVHSQQGQIMKQYEQRLIRMQKSLQDSQCMVSKYKKLHSQSNKSYQSLTSQLTMITNLISKSFSPIPSKDNNQAVEELCTIQKCKDFDQRMQKMQGLSPLLCQLIKGIRKLQGYYVESLNKKRQQRMLYLRKQAAFQKQLEDQEFKHASSNTQSTYLLFNYTSSTSKPRDQKHVQLFTIVQFRQQKYEKKIQTIAKSKAKMSEEKTNLEFIKQLFIKVLVGPKEASLMAFQVLSKVLKFTTEQYKTTQKKIK